ncbi:hypothetical protein BH23ACI1_BH23ACI1_22380 [soil metagenome]
MLRLLALILALTTTAHPTDTSTRAVVASAAAYVAEYQQQLTYVLAEETYTQQVLALAPGDPAGIGPRVIRSETFFLFTAPQHGWMAIRDVMEVDDEAVRDRRSPLEALRKLPADEVAGEFKPYNSRFNIGRTYRNFNEPTLSLLPLTERHRGRFSFNRERVQREGDIVLVTLAFRERDSPTLIRDMKGRRIFSRGELVVEAATGRVRSAELTARSADLRVRPTTEYAPEARLGMWVPVRFREEYERGSQAAGRRGQEHERIHCEAVYANYRRFETSTRIR